MKLKDPRISILINQDQTSIDVMDSTSFVTFLRVKLTPRQLSSALSRLSMTPCECEVYNLDKLGKTLEIDKLEFEMPEYNYKEAESVAKKIADSICPEGWEHDNYFASQDSFFKKDGKQMARVTIRRWI